MSLADLREDPEKDYQRSSQGNNWHGKANTSFGDMERVIVNFGCGISARHDCVNIDGSLTVLLARLPLPAVFYGRKMGFVRAIRLGRVKYGTARRLRFPQSSLDGFYASHVLEHLSRVECVNLLRRVQFWLKPTGLLRVALPDLRLLAREYVEGRMDADRFVEATHLAKDGMSFLEAGLGHAHHRWMYDSEGFSHLLRSLGWRDVKVCAYASSFLPEFVALDREVHREDESFYVEAAP